MMEFKLLSFAHRNLNSNVGTFFLEFQALKSVSADPQGQESFSVAGSSDFFPLRLLFLIIENNMLIIDQWLSFYFTAIQKKYILAQPV